MHFVDYDDDVLKCGCAFLLILAIFAIVLPIAKHLPKWQGAILISIPSIAMIVLAIIVCIAAITKKKSDTSSTTYPELEAKNQEVMPHSYPLTVEGLFLRAEDILKTPLYGKGNPIPQISLKGGIYEGNWLLEWNDRIIRLKNPPGKTVFETEPSKVHQMIDLRNLYLCRKIIFILSEGFLKFEKNPAAAAGLMTLVDQGLAADPEYLNQLRHGTTRLNWIGLGIFILSGGLSGFVYWLVSRAATLPPGHWSRWVVSLPPCLYFACIGFYFCYNGTRFGRHVRRIQGLPAKQNP